MSAPDRPTTDSAAPEHGVLPTPVSADLATDSNDPQELRRLLDRARERLSFYESFDRIIGENLRRTGEMMEETVALREQAAQAAADATEARSEMEAALRADRERYRTLIEEALAEVETARPVIDAMAVRLQSALAELSGSTPEPDARPESASDPEPAAESETEDEVEPTETAEAPQEAETTVESEVTDATDDVEEMTEPEEDIPDEPIVEAGPQVLDLIAHGVPSATTAIGLQQMLRELDNVTRVDAREFADGELRLHVECSGVLPDEPLTSWLSRNSGSLVSRNGKAIELTFS